MYLLYTVGLIQLFNRKGVYRDNFTAIALQELAGLTAFPVTGREGDLLEVFDRTGTMVVIAVKLETFQLCLGHSAILNVRLQAAV